MTNNQRPFSFFQRGGKRQRVSLNLPAVSLMWPEPPAVSGGPAYVETGARAGSAAVQFAWHRDLGLEEMVNAFTDNRRHKPYIRQTLSELNTDVAVIAWRQAVFADLYRYPALLDALEAMLPRLANLRYENVLLGKKRRSLLLEASDHLAELDLYVELVADLHDALNGLDLQAEALTGLRANLAELLKDENFQTLRDELPALRQPLERIASLTIGVNLDSELKPESAVLLAINDKHLGEASSFLEKLIGSRMDASDESGIADLHYVPKESDMRPFSQLFQDLDRLVSDVAQPVARALEKYSRVTSGTLSALEQEIAFLVAAVRLTQRMEGYGVVFCQPEIIPEGERITQLDGLVNAALCLRLRECPVPSDAHFDDTGRIALLTGPNSGGKTTYLQAVGLAHVLFQAGLFVPARSARMSPARTLLTHFPRLETREQGRLEEEALRLREMFSHAHPSSLVLLNETFSSTTFGEALYLAQDILSALRHIGVRAVYATHFVELVGHMDEIEHSIEGPSKLFSLVAGIALDADIAHPNFNVTRGMPLGRSYAREIARRHGISLEQILDQRKGSTPR